MPGSYRTDRNGCLGGDDHLRGLRVGKDAFSSAAMVRNLTPYFNSQLRYHEQRKIPTSVLAMRTGLRLISLITFHQ